MMGAGHGLWGMGGGFGALLGLAFWATVIGLVIWGLRTLLDPRERAVGADALAIVARRFASGEISQAEFELARRAITTDRATRNEHEGSKTMRNRTKALLVAGLLATTLALGTVGSTLAQTIPTAPDTTHAYCQQGALHDAVAQALGISTDELNAAQAAGKTVAQLASERGVDLGTVTAAVLQTHQQGLDAQVQAGRLTQAQADFMQAQMTAHLGAMFSGQFGPMMMGQSGMMGAGMMSPGGMMGAGMMGGPGHMNGPGHMSGPGHGPQR